MNHRRTQRNSLRRTLRSAAVRVDALEPRQLFAFDIGFVDASAAPGTYSPGQTLTTTFTFKNSGDTASPPSHYYAQFLADITGEDPNQYGGIPYDFPPTGFDLPALAPGETRPITLTLPVSQTVFNGGPYFFYVVAGFDDQALLAQDANPVDNFGFSSAASVTITGGIGRGGSGGPIGTPPDGVVGDLDTSFGDGNDGVADSLIPGAPLTTLATVFDPVTSRQFALADRGDSLALLRFDAFGELDPAYGDFALGDASAAPGVLTLSAAGGGGLDGATLIRLPDGRLVVAGSLADGSGAYLARFSSDGLPDGAFGTAGALVVPTAALPNGGSFDTTALVPAPDGSLFVVGTTGPLGARDMAVLKLTPAGVPDASFDADGLATIDLATGDDTVRAAALNSKGQLVLAGSTTLAGTTRATAVRLNASGARDAKFGTKGAFTLTVTPGASEEFTAITVGAKDVLFLAGYSASGSGFATTSLAFATAASAVGKVTSSFGSKGIARLTNLAAVSPLASPNTLLLTPDAGLLIAAQTADSVAGASAGQVGAALARLDAKGKPVTSFGTNGVSEILQPSAITPAAAPGLDADFNTFLQSRDGAATVIPGGKVRAVASQPAGDSSTLVQIAQLTADGVDIAPVFGGSVPARVKAGAKGSVKVNLSNLGTLPANGPATLTLTLTPAGAGTSPVSGTLGTSTLKLKLKAGTTLKSTVKAAFPRTASGLYSVLATFSSPLDIGVQNNSASSPNQINVQGTPAAAARAFLIQIDDTPPAAETPVAAGFAAPPSTPDLELVRDRLFSVSPVLA